MGIGSSVLRMQVNKTAECLMSVCREISFDPMHGKSNGTAF
jgi:hypothetical protein